MTRIRAYTLAEFIDRYLPAQRPARRIKATVLHHTWSPTPADYKGLSTIQGIQRFHMQDRHWSDIGANAYAAPDGLVYNGRPLSDGNYAHAQIGRLWSSVPSDIKALAYPDKGWLNKYAFGIETIGNFDEEPIDPIPRALDTALRVLAGVHELFNLPPTRLFLHRDVAEKSCPGDLISRQWARAELAKRMGGETMQDEVKIVLLPDKLLDCHARIENGTTRCDLRPLAEALGCEIVTQHVKEQGKIYLRAKSAVT